MLMTFDDDDEELCSPFAEWSLNRSLDVEVGDV